MVDRSSPDIESVEMTIFKEMFNGLDLSDEVKMELSERANLHTIARNIRLSLQPARCSAGIESALRDAFPHFEADAPITADAIRKIGREYLDMVMGWEPQKTEIEFSDYDGNIKKIVYEPGEFESGLYPGWVLDGEPSDDAQSEQEPRLAERLTDVVMMLDTPDAYNREYIAAVCRSILSSVSSTPRETPHDR